MADVNSSIRRDRRSANYYFGPHSEQSGALEFERLRMVLSSIRKSGYEPRLHPPMTGYFVTSGGEYSFVVGSGNHRMAVLAALGIKTAVVELHSHPAIIDESDLHRFTTAGGCAWEPPAARQVFELYLDRRARQRPPASAR